MLSPALVLVALLAVAASVAAVAAPSPRVATVGAFGAVLLAALVADPLPSAAAVVARMAGAVLGGWLVWVSLRPVTASSSRPALGWLGTSVAAGASFAIGWLAASALGTAVATVVGDGLVANVPGATLAGGSVVARAGIAAAAAIAVVAAAPVVLPRDGHRLGLGAVLLIAAAGLLGDALAPAPAEGLALALAVLTALAGAAIAGVVLGMLRTGGDLVLRDALARDAAVRHRAADDAHRGGAR